MHMHKENNGPAPVQHSCDMCLFTSYLSCVLKSHLDRKHLGISKTFVCNRWDFSAKSKGVLKHHEHLKHKNLTLTCELCNYRTSNAQYLNSHMQALCQADYSLNIGRLRSWFNLS